MKTRFAVTAAVSLFSVSLSMGTSLLAQAVPPSVKTAEASIDGEKIRAQVKFLSDDLLEGRGPGLRGSELAAKYIATQFALYGLKPGGDNGTYLQQIDFVGMNAIPAKTTFSLVPKKPSTGMSIDLYSIDLKYGDDYTVSNRTLTPSVDIDAPIVFVGYGVDAPEFHWNDYANIDVKGKVILCIVGDPPSDDPKFFGGNALTYYGRWTYKFEEAARKGAIGALIIHRTDLASYGWDVVKNSNTSEKTYLRNDKNPQLQAASWIQLDVAQKLFASARLNADTEENPASKPSNSPSASTPTSRAPSAPSSPPTWSVSSPEPMQEAPIRPSSTPPTTTISASSPACPATTSTTEPPTTPPA